MNRMYQVDCKRGLCSTGFYVGIVMCFLAGAFGMGEMLEYISETVLPEGEIRFLSAAYLALHTDALTYVLPIACTLAASGMYIEDLQSGTLYYSILRTTKKRYYTSKILSCITFGILTVLATVLLLMVAFMLMFPTDKMEIQNFQMESLVYLCKRTVILCMNSSLYALLGGAIAGTFNNRYMAYAAPFILYYVISTLFQAYLSDYPLLNPKEWMLLRNSPVCRVVVVLAVANVLAAACYLFIMERRWTHE